MKISIFVNYQFSGNTLIFIKKNHVLQNHIGETINSKLMKKQK